MKKIQKIDSTSSQSVYSFYCPCSGTCQSCPKCEPYNLSSAVYSGLLSVNYPQASTLA